MSLYGSVEDGRRVRLPNVTGRLALDFQQVTFTGTTTVKFVEFDTVLMAILDQVIGTSPGVGGSTFTYTINNNVVSIFAWQPTSNANPTLVAATNSTTVSVGVLGVRRQGQNI